MLLPYLSGIAEGRPLAIYRLRLRTSSAYSEAKCGSSAWGSQQTLEEWRIDIYIADDLLACIAQLTYRSAAYALYGEHALSRVKTNPGAIKTRKHRVLQRESRNAHLARQTRTARGRTLEGSTASDVCS